MPVRNNAVGGSRLRLQMTDSKLSTTDIMIIYGVGMAFWLFLTFFLELWPDTSKTTKLFLLIPFAVFIINMITPTQGSDIVLDPHVTQGNFISYIIIGGSVLTPWFTTLQDKKKWHHIRVIKVFILVVLFLTLTQFDFFILRYIGDIEVHINAVLNTYILAFIGYAVSEFFHIEYKMIPKWGPKRRPRDDPPVSYTAEIPKRTQAQEIAIEKQRLIAASQVDFVTPYPT